MKRIVIAAMGTLSAVVMVLVYPTSTNRPVTTLGAASVAAPAATVAAGAAAAPAAGAAAAPAAGAAAAPAAGAAAAPAGTTAAAGTTTTTTDTAAAPAAAAQAPAAQAPAAQAPAATSVSGTFDGKAVNTRWGVVQVEIVVANGSITSANAIQHPSGERESDQINAYAVPVLNSEVVAAQSAKIDMVSGASVTSGGYLKSLQDAIDQAHL